MRVRQIVAAAAAATLALGLTACGSDSEKKAAESKGLVDKAKSDKKLIVGVKYEQPALGLKKPDGSLEGFDVDVAKYIAGKLGVPESGIEFKEARSENRESFLQTGQVDLVIATYSITDSRKPKVTFGGPYYVARQDTMVKADNNAIKTAQDLKGKKICKAAGSNSWRRVTDPAPDGKLDLDATLVDATGYADCTAKLASGAVDAVSTDDLILAGFAAQQKGKFKVINDPFTDEKYGVGIRKGDTAGCEAVNKAITEMYTDGTAKKLLEKHFTGAGLKLQTDKAPTFEGCA
ncbi:glutamate ABC transporter substrate-binding protein [Actinomadura kijaniata]|uniref:Glutamate transport system substrate-binding protein n=1 Tax=Actinomadura namibiensis TaxID=182080 RepID=A0A7W3QJT1_ACTNM|nr:glutamate ABC transporter substrate-binding protein [Actinomadura namibiensis]MBA8949662.1 glutamate transport system substrate-binding protein [Actinomadura namibiensis]